jgi:hypothetical protein
VLRDEGVCLTAVWIDSPRLDLAGDLATLGVRPDTVELQLPGCVQPTDDVLHAVEAARRIHAGAVALAPLLPHERVPGRYHPRGRIGYRPEELAALGERLRDAGCAPLRAVAFLDPTRPPWDALRELSACGTCDSIGGIDAALPLPAGEDERLQVIAGSLCAAAAAGDVHLWLDPYVDLDRTNDLHRGLLDRLGNPGRAFHAARALNTLLVSASSWTWLDGDGSTFVLQSQGAELAIFTSTPADARLDALPAPGPGTLVCDLGAATVRAAGDLDTRSRALRDAALPCAVWHGPPFASAHRSP